MTNKAEQLLAEAKRLLKTADERQAAADDAKWAAAERMWKANREEGATQQEIANVLGISRITVNRHVSVWEARSNKLLQPGVTFTEAFYEHAGGGVSRPEKDDERAATRTLRSANQDTIERVVAALPPERQAAVARAAIRSAGDEVMADPQTRMRARAAAERQANAAQAQAESERKAHAASLREDTEDVVDGRALTELGGALGRIIGTTRAAAEIWKRWEPRVSEAAREAAIDDIGNTQARLDTILDAMRGADMDEALAKILAETEDAR